MDGGLRGWCGVGHRLLIHVVDFTTGQVGNLPHVVLANRSQFCGTLFAEALEFVEGAVKSSLQTAFLAVEQAQCAFAPSGCVAHATGVIQIEILLDGREDFQFGGVEAGFLMVEAPESPIGQS
jgi:hypothetical protein